MRKKKKLGRGKSGKKQRNKKKYENKNIRSPPKKIPRGDKKKSGMNQNYTEKKWEKVHARKKRKRMRKKKKTRKSGKNKEIKKKRLSRARRRKERMNIRTAKENGKRKKNRQKIYIYTVKSNIRKRGES